MLRVEDIDITRCKPEFEQAIYEDLQWLGLQWETPVRRQSNHLDAYRRALDGLIARDLAYPAFMSRGEIKTWVAAHEASGRAWSRDPDGAMHYPPEDRLLSAAERKERLDRGDKHVWRLDMAKAVAVAGRDLTFRETTSGAPIEIATEPLAWGDVVLWRSDAPSSYHLSVTVDDAIQGVTHVVRGLDLYASTGVHRLLQQLLELPVPLYHHHRLITDSAGRKLSKSDGDVGLCQLRAAGASPQDIRRLVGL